MRRAVGATGGPEPGRQGCRPGGPVGRSIRRALPLMGSATPLPAGPARSGSEQLEAFEAAAPDRGRHGVPDEATAVRQEQTGDGVRVLQVRVESGGPLVRVEDEWLTVVDAVTAGLGDGGEDGRRSTARLARSSESSTAGSRQCSKSHRRRSGRRPPRWMKELLARTPLWRRGPSAIPALEPPLSAGTTAPTPLGRPGEAPLPSTVSARALIITQPSRRGLRPWGPVPR